METRLLVFDTSIFLLPTPYPPGAPRRQTGWWKKCETSTVSRQRFGRTRRSSLVSSAARRVMTRWPFTTAPVHLDGFGVETLSHGCATTVVFARQRCLRSCTQSTHRRFFLCPHLPCLVVNDGVELHQSFIGMVCKILCLDDRPEVPPLWGELVVNFLMGAVGRGGGPAF